MPVPRMIPGRVHADALASAEAGDFATAAQLFEKAAAQSPDDATLHEQRAQCLLEAGDAAGAVAAAADAVRVDPRWAAARVTLARASLNAGKFADAVKQFGEALALDAASADDIGDDLDRARALVLEQDEVALEVNGVALTLQQWRGDDDADATCQRCPLPSAAPAPRRDGTGTMVWECGIVLARLFATRHGRRALASGGSVVELGAGTGIAGLAAAAAGATRVLLTDLPSVVTLLAANAARNAAALGDCALDVCSLDWTRDALHERAVGMDLVIGADLVYHSSQIAPLVSVLRRMLAPTAERPAGARLLLAHKSRHEAVDAELHAALRGAGIAIAAVPTSELAAEARAPSITVFEGRWAGAPGS